MTARRRAAQRALAVWLGALLAGSLALPARASEPADGPEPDTAAPEAAFEPGAWTLGSWTLTPQLLTAGGYNSNLRLQSQAVQGSVFTALLPSLTLAQVQGEERRQWSWRSEWTRFADSQADSTLNSELAHEGVTVLDARSALAWRLAAQDWHDTVAQPDPTLPVSSPDHFQVLALGGVWRMDRGEDARHRLEFEPTLSSKRYHNHRELTVQADADTASLIARYLQRREGDERIGLEWRGLRSFYPNNTQSLSNIDQRALAVYQSDPGQRLVVQARAGWQWRRFTRLRPEQGLATWEIELQGSPWANALLELGSSRAASDVPGEGSDAVVARRLQLAWTQRWGARSHSTVTLSHTRSAYVNFLPRTETLRSLDLAWRADLDRRWQWGANWGALQRVSDPADFSFRRRLMSLVLTAAL